MRYSFLYSLKYTYSDRHITLKWNIQDEDNRKATVVFTTGLDYDAPRTGLVRWDRPDGTKGEYLWDSDISRMSPADAAHAFLILISKSELERLREHVQQPPEHQRLSMARERWLEGGLPGTASEVVYPTIWIITIDDPEVDEVFQALFDQYDGQT